MYYTSSTILRPEVHPVVRAFERADARLAQLKRRDLNPDDDAELAGLLSEIASDIGCGHGFSSGSVGSVVTAAAQCWHFTQHLVQSVSV
jgi:hypothetical protein